MPRQGSGGGGDGLWLFVRREETDRNEEWRVARNGNGYLLDGVVDIQGHNVILGAELPTYVKLNEHRRDNDTFETLNYGTSSRKRARKRKVSITHLAALRSLISRACSNTRGLREVQMHCGYDSSHLRRRPWLFVFGPNTFVSPRRHAIVFVLGSPKTTSVQLAGRRLLWPSRNFPRPPAQVVTDASRRSLKWPRPSSRIYSPESLVTLHTRVIVTSFHRVLGVTTEAPRAGDLSQHWVRPSAQLHYGRLAADAWAECPAFRDTPAGRHREALLPAP